MADELTGGGTVFGASENSMAAAIERQLNELLADAGLDQLPTATRRRPATGGGCSPRSPAA